MGTTKLILLNSLLQENDYLEYQPGVAHRGAGRAERREKGEEVP